MGAYSILSAFDVERLREQVAPAVRATLEADVGIDLRRDCALLDDTLGLAATRPASLPKPIPSMNGACSSETCAVSARCPMHVFQSGPLLAEPFGDSVQRAVTACCVAEPLRVVLGRRGTLYDLACLHERAHGRDEQAAFLVPDTPFVVLAKRLAQRAAAWGWGDGGSGEGVLGWLDASEARAMAHELDALLTLAKGLPSVDGDEAYDEALRDMAEGIRTQASRCAAVGLGVLLRRE